MSGINGGGRQECDGIVILRTTRDPSARQVAERRIFDACFHGLVRYLSGIVPREDAEEIASDVLLAFLQDPHRFDPELARLSTYLAVIGKRRALDLNRRTATAVRVPLADLPGMIEPVEENRVSISQRATLLQLRWAIERLPEVSRNTMLLYMEGLDVADIAKLLDSKAGTIRTRICRAKETLRQTLSYAKYPFGRHGPES
jgi:RNA polymerase sigma-70 factor, ECF subfamily